MCHRWAKQMKCLIIQIIFPQLRCSILWVRTAFKKSASIGSQYCYVWNIVSIVRAQSQTTIVAQMSISLNPLCSPMECTVLKQTFTYFTSRFEKWELREKGEKCKLIITPRSSSYAYSTLKIVRCHQRRSSRHVREYSFLATAAPMTQEKCGLISCKNGQRFLKTTS